MKTKHLWIILPVVAIALSVATPERAEAACDSCVSHALPTRTAYYAPAPMVRTSYYAPAATSYSTYYRPRWWRSWWRAPRTVYAPSVARTAYYAPTTAYYAPTAVAAPGCSTCAPASACSTCVSYRAQTSYKVQIVNRPVTTMQPTTVVDGCTGCARTVMRPVTTYVHQQQYVPTTTYRPVCSTGCSTGCSTCVSACPADCTGCASCAGGAATIQQLPATQQQNTPTEAGEKPELRLKPVPEKDTHDHDHDAGENARKAKVRSNDFPRLTDPNDRTARLETRPVRTASYQQPVSSKQRVKSDRGVTYRQVGEGGWYSPK